MQIGYGILALLAVAANTVKGAAGQGIGWAPFIPRAIAYGRLDPILSPGKVSPHTHMFFGPNNIQPDAAYETLRDSTCTVTGAGDADYSAYWVPAMYHVSADNKYTLLPMKGSEIYYGYARNGSDTPYPPGFQMIVGNPMASRHNCSGGTPTSASCNKFGGYFYCLDSDKPKGYGLLSDLPRGTRCNDRIGYHITFPQCWDGKDFTFETQDQHLRYGTPDFCPPGYKRLPQIMFDFWFDTIGLPVNSPDKDTYTLAFGGKMGAGLHGDFMNGWDPAVMQNIISNCASTFTGGSNDPFRCPILKQKQNEQYARLEKQYGDRRCRFTAKLPQENIGLGSDGKRTALPALPGCNPMHTVDGKMPTCATTCEPPLGAISKSFFPGIYAPLPATTTCSVVSAAASPATGSPSTSSTRANPKGTGTAAAQSTATYPKLVRTPVTRTTSSTPARTPANRARHLKKHLH